MKLSTPCIWSASASGGTGAYSYAWKVNGQPIGGNAMDVTYTNSGSGFAISVTVSAAGINPGTASMSVAVSSGAPICQN